MAQRTRKIEIVAQDPSLKRDGKIVTAQVEIPFEDLNDGPMGFAVHVVDYDASTESFYAPAVMPDSDIVKAPSSASKILDDPEYHALNVYALVMRTLGRFEFALGRRVGWGIDGHQLKVVPHAFEEANAFYSPRAEALMFGYVRSTPPIFLCLSHDVVVHETAHALLDGLRERFMRPSSPDQAALHEAFADIVALLSVFSLHEILGYLLDAHVTDGTAPEGMISRSLLTEDALKDSVLLGLAEEMRDENDTSRVNALRRSVLIDPNKRILTRLEFRDEPHRRAEVVVAAFMRAFVTAWSARAQRLGSPGGDFIDRQLAAEQGAIIADLLMTMAIRAIDYTPPIHIVFGDFLSAVLTADSEIRTDDSRYELRAHLAKSFDSYGMTPSSKGDAAVPGRWDRPSDLLDQAGLHFQPLQTDRNEMFRLVWNNRRTLRLDSTALTRVQSVRPCVRVSPDDGFQLRETVVEVTQYKRILASQLGAHGLAKPATMDKDFEFSLEGGATLVLDEFCELKFHISNALPSKSDSAARKKVSQERLEYLFNNGFLGPDRRNFSNSLGALHAKRARGDEIGISDWPDPEEAWT